MHRIETVGDFVTVGIHVIHKIYFSGIIIPGEFFCLFRVRLIRRHTRAVAVQRVNAYSIPIRVYGVEFVHAEGEDEGKPMPHLPVFTPQDGIGQGEPIYDCPSVDLAFALSPPNGAGLRSVAVTYLGAQYALTETAPASLAFTNGATSLTLSGAQEWVSAAVSIPTLGITNAVYTCVETAKNTSAFANDLYWLVFAIGNAPSGIPRTAMLDIGNEYYSKYEMLKETAVGTGIFTNRDFSVSLLQISGQPSFAVSDGMFHTNTIFTVWETAPQSGIYRNHNPPILTDMSPEDLAMTDFTPWRLKIAGITDPSLVEEVSITTSVDSTNKITFTSVNGSLLSSQKFIIIPDGVLAAPPPVGYVPIRSDVTSPVTRGMSPHSVVAFLTLKGCAPAQKEINREKDAIVWRSLKFKLDEKNKIVKPLQEMGYNVELRTTATRQWVLDNIQKKSVWYSMCEGTLLRENLYVNDPDLIFEGLMFEGGAILRQSDIEGLGLDYKLVMVDACCSAMTIRLTKYDYDYKNRLLPSDPRKVDVQDYHNLVPECKAFASAFGQNVAYVGWAWVMPPTGAQGWTSQFLNNLKGGKTVAQAHAEFLLAHNAIAPKSGKDQRMMKIYNAIDNVIDKTPQK